MIGDEAIVTGTREVWGLTARGDTAGSVMGVTLSKGRVEDTGVTERRVRVAVEEGGKDDRFAEQTTEGTKSAKER